MSARRGYLAPSSLLLLSKRFEIVWGPGPIGGNISSVRGLYSTLSSVRVRPGSTDHMFLRTGVSVPDRVACYTIS